MKLIEAEMSEIAKKLVVTSVSLKYGKPDSRGSFANFTRQNSNLIWQIPEVRLQIPFSIFEIQNLYC